MTLHHAEGWRSVRPHARDHQRNSILTDAIPESDQAGDQQFKSETRAA